MKKRTSGSKSPTLPMAGAVAVPVAQWVVFFLISRSGGAHVAGEYALALTIANSCSVATNFGLRDLYITSSDSPNEYIYWRLRFSGLTISAATTVVLATLLGLDFGIVALTALFRAAESALDIMYAPLQRSRSLIRFGSLMLLNAGVTTGLAFLVWHFIGTPVAIIAASVVGSFATIVAGSRPGWRLCRDHGSIESSAWREARFLLSKAAPIAIAQAFSALILYLPTWAVAGLGTTAEVGTFAAVFYVIVLANVVGSSVSAAHIGEFKALIDLERQQVARRRAVQLALRLAVLGLLAAAALVWQGSSLLVLVYGDQFLIPRLYLGLLGAAAIFSGCTYILTSLLLACGMYKTQLRIVVWSFAGAGSTLALTSLLGVSGFLAGALVAFSAGLTRVGLTARTMFRILPVIANGNDTDKERRADG